MQYHHRNRLLPPPPPPPFGRGGGAGYPRGRKQLYAPPPPFPPMPPAPQHKYEVLMEAGRLAAEYLVSQGVLPPVALQRGTGAWAVPPLPPVAPPLPPQQQEPPLYYGRRRYEDEYINNPSVRHMWTNGTTSSCSSRDDYNSGSSNGRGKRKYGEYRRGYSDSGRNREERRRAFSNSRCYEEDENENGAPGFHKEWRGNRQSDEVGSSIAEATREEMSFKAKIVEELDKEDTKSKVVSCAEDVQKDADAVPKVQDENEEGELNDDSEVLTSESEVMEQAIDDDIGVMESESNQLPDGKVPNKEAEDSVKISDEAAFDDSTLDDDVTNVENNMCVVTQNLLAYCDFVRVPTRPRSVRACRNATSVSGGTAVAATTDLVSSEQASQMVIDESAKQSFQSISKSENGEDQIYPENNNSSAGSDEPMLLQENGTSVVTENIREEKGDERLQVVQEYKEETSLSPFTASHMDNVPQEDSFMQETDLSPLTASHKDSLPQEDSLIQEIDLPPLTASHKNSFIEETKLSPLPVSPKENLMQETHLSQAMSYHENNLKLQFNEGAQACGSDTVQQVDLIELSDQWEVVGADLYPNVGAESTIKLEDGKLDQSDSLKVSDLDLVGGTEVAESHDNITLAQSSAAGSSTEPHEKHLEDLGNTASANVNATDDLCQLPLENKDVQLTNIECNTPIEVGGFGSSKSKNEMACSSMDNIMHPGLHADILPDLQDSYGLAFSDFLSDGIPCYPPTQSNLHAGIGASNSEGITIMDDPIYESLTDIGFMDVWGQPTQDDDKFF